MADSNVNLNSTVLSGNTGLINAFPDLGILTAVVLVPKGTIIPASAMVSTSAFETYVNGKFIADLRKNRWFAFNGLDKFTDETKKVVSEDTGIYQFDIFSFPNKFSFRMMKNAGNMGNFIEATRFQNTQAFFDIFFIDSNGNCHGTVDQTGGGGLQAYDLQQFFVPPSMRRTVSTNNQYMVNVQLSSSYETNGGFALYQAGYDAANIAMLQNAVMSDVSAVLGTPLTITTTTDIVCILKAGEGSEDLASPGYYQSALTKACFVASNLTLGTTLTISTLTKGTIVVAGQVYNYLWFILSAAPTVGNVVQIALAAPSAVNAIIPGFDAVTEIVQVGVDSANAAVHTF
jgi:hypothetical protein